MEKSNKIYTPISSSLPIATVVNNNTQTSSLAEIIPVAIATPDINNIPQQILMRCRECNNDFYAQVKDKGSCAYYRCQQCRKHFLSRSLISSCIIN